MLKATFISTLALNEASLRPLARAQKQLVDAQTELGTGRRADLVLALGGSIEGLVAARGIVADSSALRQSNVQVSNRLEAAQSSLDVLARSSQDFFSTLVSAGSGSWKPDVVDRAAKSSMALLAEQLGTTVQGAHVFSGTNVGEAPLADYFGNPTPPARTAVQNAFSSYFGFPAGDPAASNITVAQITDFLSNQLEPQFNDANWKANWSQASDELLTDRITSSSEIQTGVSANDVQFRKLAKAFVMMGDLGIASMSAEVRDVVVRTASATVSEAIGGIADVQSKLGLDQAMTSQASERLSTREALVNAQIEHLEGVDPAEVSTRISTLMTRIEASYSLTARLHRLSLIDVLG